MCIRICNGNDNDIILDHLTLSSNNEELVIA
jgi:hypothetical protein